MVRRKQNFGQCNVERGVVTSVPDPRKSELGHLECAPCTLHNPRAQTAYGALHNRPPTWVQCTAFITICEAPKFNPKLAVGKAEN